MIDKAMWLNPAGQEMSAAFVDIFGAVELISALLIGFGFMTRVGACAIILTAIIGYIGQFLPIVDILSAGTHCNAVPQGIGIWLSWLN